MLKVNKKSPNDDHDKRTIYLNHLYELRNCYLILVSEFKIVCISN